VQITGAYGNKGNALGNLQPYEDALAAFDRALRLDPTMLVPTLIRMNYYEC